MVSLANLQYAEVWNRIREKSWLREMKPEQSILKKYIKGD